MAEVMTYNSLVTDTRTYVERQDVDFLVQIPRLIMMAENQLAQEVRNLGFRRAVTGTFVVANQTLAKPARWRRTVSLNYGLSAASTAARNFVLPRSYEFCRAYWPVPATTGNPKYYADYDWENWLLVPTPVAAYPFELIYHERPQPLDATTQVNWTTQHAPQLLLFQVLLQCQPFLKNQALLATYQAMYGMAKAALDGEEHARVAAGDRTQHVQAP